MARGMTDAAEAATAYLLLCFSILYRFIGGGRKLVVLMCNAPDSSHEMPRDIPEMEQYFSDHLFLQTRQSLQCTRSRGKSDDIMLDERQPHETNLETFAITVLSSLIAELGKKTNCNHGEHHRENQGVSPVIQTLFKRISDTLVESRRR